MSKVNVRFFVLCIASFVILCFVATCSSGIRVCDTRTAGKYKCDEFSNKIKKCVKADDGSCYFTEWIDPKVCKTETCSCGLDQTVEYSVTLSCHSDGSGYDCTKACKCKSPSKNVGPGPDDKRGHSRSRESKDPGRGGYDK